MPIDWSNVPESQWGNLNPGVPKLSADNLDRLMVAEDAGTPGTPTGDALRGSYAPIRVRGTATAATGTLAPGASENLSIPLAIGFRLYTIQTSVPARVRVYDTAAHRAADAGRTIGVDPASDAGVILEYVTGDSATHSLSPMVDGASMESTPSASIAMTVTNLDTAAGTVAVTFSFLRTE